jgi:hypothetical protein
MGRRKPKKKGRRMNRTRNRREMGIKGGEWRHGEGKWTETDAIVKRWIWASQ